MKEGDVVIQAFTTGEAGELDERGYGEDCPEDASSIWSLVVRKELRGYQGNLLVQFGQRM